MLTYSIGASLVAVIGLSRFFDPAVSGIDRVSAFANESATHFGAISCRWSFSLSGCWPVWKRLGTIEQTRMGRGVVLLPASLLGLIVSGTRSAWIAVVFGIGVLFLGQRRSQNKSDDSRSGHFCNAGRRHSRLGRRRPTHRRSCRTATRIRYFVRSVGPRQYLGRWPRISRQSNCWRRIR